MEHKDEVLDIRNQRSTVTFCNQRSAVRYLQQVDGAGALPARIQGQVAQKVERQFEALGE